MNDNTNIYPPLLPHPVHEEMTFKMVIIKTVEWSRYLSKKWLIVLIAAVLGAIIGFYRESGKKPTYMARTTFVLENTRPGGGGDLGGLASVFGLEIGGGAAGETFSGTNLYELMASRSMVQKVLLRPLTMDGKTQSYADFYIDIKKYREKWKDDPKLKNLHFPIDADPASFSLEQNSMMTGFYSTIVKDELSVAPKKGGGFSTMIVTSESELFAKNFSETFLKVVSEYYVDVKMKKSLENYAILQSKTDSMKRILNSSISRVASSIDANPNSNAARLEQLRVPSQQKMVDVQATQALYMQLMQNIEMAKISLRKEMPLIQVIDGPVLPLDLTIPSKTNGMIFWATICAILGIGLLMLRRTIILTMRS